MELFLEIKKMFLKCYLELMWESNMMTFFWRLVLDHSWNSDCTNTVVLSIRASSHLDTAPSLEN